MSDNPSFVLRTVQDAVFEDRRIPEIKDDEVLIAVKKTGICGSDVHFFVDGHIGPVAVEKPMVLGHESAGVVCKVGQKVKTLKEGDRVAMEPGATCRVCDDCKRGRYELCPEMKFAATPPHDGTLSWYYALPADLCYKLPDHLTLEDGALMEPLSVAVHAIATISQLRATQSVAVFGAGPVGLLCMAVARALGASRVVAVDVVPARLAFAQEYAATETYAPLEPEMRDGDHPEGTLAYSLRNARAMMVQLGIGERGPSGIDLAVDASGAEVAIQTGLLVVKHGGTFVQVGIGGVGAQIPALYLLAKELVYKGSFRYGPGDYQLAMALVRQGKIDLAPLVTHRYSFNEAARAFEAVRTGKSEDGKPVIKVIISGPDVSPVDLM
ncbi:xylitol dehydrogenase [Lentinus tigrinus ALCF2SS1-6]|uniref:Xylitol dehydrogenase n=1 Tax=Lentinus tigrinus ALCF2SS1-6 TaxID=1328759 RepID=A0A5C2STK3_9APHY|nr:xylitol dehydrogenase [Lentinus tigrinus ALCF2SS1-6]